MKKYINVIKPIIFCLICVLVFAIISPLFKVQDFRCPETAEGFRKEPADSLDVVFIGASSTYAAWQPPIAYNDYGFTSYTLALPHLNKVLTVGMIEEARKTQPDAIYVIPLNCFREREINKDHFHHTLDYLPMSANKAEMISVLNDHYGLTSEQFLEFYLPFYRFHSGWDELETRSFAYDFQGYKNGQIFDNFVNGYKEEHGNYVYTAESAEVSDEDKDILDGILNYCRDNDLKVAFVMLPQALVTEYDVMTLNGVTEYVRNAGFDVLDLLPPSDHESYSLDLGYDYYNGLHNNIHGSYKVVHKIGAYLKERFDIPEEHSSDITADWDAVTEAYFDEYIRTKLADFEISHAPRDTELSAPELISLAQDSKGFTLTWSPSENADGYIVYRKDNIDKEWAAIKDIDDQKSTSLLDDSVKLKRWYTYAVAPYRIENGEYIYGQFNFRGLHSKFTGDPAAEIVSEEPDMPDESSSEDDL